MRIQLLQADQEGSLTNFVEKHPQGSIEQTWGWGILQTGIPGRDSFFVLGVFEGEVLCASMLVIRQSMGLGKTWLWCPGGPLLPVKDTEKAWGILMQELKVRAKKAGDVFLRIEPWAPAGSSFNFGGKVSTGSYLPRNSLVLDLSLPEEALLQQMTQKGRYNIKLAAREGVYVRNSDSEEIRDFYELLKETAKRDGFSLHKISFYQNFVDMLGENSFMLTARVDGVLVGGILGSQFGQTVTYYFGASSGKHRQKMAPYALQWWAIRDAKVRGFKRYDFLGIAPEGDLKHPLSGVTQFKTRFGGDRINYEPAQVFVFRNVWWWIYRVGKFLRNFV